MHSPQPHILIVEDDDALAGLLVEYLGQHGFTLDRAASGDDGVRQINALQPDLVVLDLMLPGMSGLEVCRQVRGRYTGAIVMLTASQSDADHVSGLELGADDFVIKPIEPRVLLARIRTQLRRTGAVRPSAPTDDGWLRVAPLRIDVAARQAYIEDQGVSLTSMEFDILLMLARHGGSVVERDTLYTEILDIEYDGIDRGMDVHISRIRRKLQRSGFDPTRLKSVRGVGYLLAAR
ncbi:MAG: response regulator [Bradymonadia bacterium]